MEAKYSLLLMDTNIFGTNRKAIHSIYAVFYIKKDVSAKLDKEVNLLYPKSVHDHELHHTDIHLIKTKCKRIAQTSQHNLREIFNDITRSDPSGTHVRFKERESSMFRARKILQAKIPASANDFFQLLPETTFALHLKATVTLGNRIAVIFFSDI